MSGSQGEVVYMNSVDLS